MISILNAGARLVSTDYWLTEHAKAGLVYLTGNAGALRLLVPAAALGMLAEMRTGQRVTIERSLHSGAAGCVDIVFEDGSNSPFSVAVDTRQMDRALTAGAAVPFLVYTEDEGAAVLALELAATITV